MKTKQALLERFYAALQRRDIDAILQLVEGDYVADWSRSRGPHRGVYRGEPGIQQLTAEFFDTWERMEFFTTAFVPVGEAIVRVGGFRGLGRESGIEIEGKGAQLVEFGAEGIRRVTLFQSEEDAVRAAEAGDS
jgi:hypothetical protein